MINRRHRSLFAIAAALGYALLLIVVPLGSIVQQSFSNGVSGFLHAISSPLSVATLRLTMELSILASLINAIIGAIVAYALVRVRIPLHGLLNALVDLPFTIPTTITGLMLILLYQPNSVLGGWFQAHGVHILFLTTGIVLAMVLVTFPFTVRAVQPLLEQMDRNTEDAARTLGAGSVRIFFKLVMPAILPGIWNGLTLTFNRSLSEFGSIVIVSGNIPYHTQVASVYLYGLLENSDQQGASAIAVLMLFISTVALLVQLFLARSATMSLIGRAITATRLFRERRRPHAVSDWTI